MNEKNKTKDQYSVELSELYQRIGELEKSEEFLQTLVNTIGDPIMVIDPSNYRIVLANKASENLYDGENPSASSLTCYQLSHRRDEPCAAPDEPCPVRQILATKEPVRVTHTHYDSDNKQIDVDIIATPILNEEGDVVRIIEVCRDVTNIQKMEMKLKKSEEKYRSLVESTEDSIYSVDKDYRYLFMNKNHIARMGFSEDEYLNRTYGEFHSPDETKWFVANVDKVFASGKSVKHEHKSRRDDSYFLQTLSPVKDADGKIIAATIVSKNINDLKRLEEKLRTLSITDELTGLFNRRGFFTLADQQIKLAHRHKAGIFMLYADLNGLKKINDKLGHTAGDSALIDIANLLKKTYRESDVVARIGGDEFAVIPIGTTEDNAEIISARFQDALNIHNNTMNRQYMLSASVGLAHYDPDKPCSLDELLMQADKMMYKQKTNHLK
jgi:diguanylate cyclase (GGDEF)-like protein/PAS domain S-box-containing protein